MRVISGKYRSLEIGAPRGRDVRPTTDRVREGMFSSLLSMHGELNGAVVLDVFAGTGALSIESLSRGAAHALMGEHDKKVAQNLRQNLERIKIPDEDFTLLNVDSTSPALKPAVDRALTSFGKTSVDIIFLDPPYAMQPSDVLDILQNLDGVVSEETTIVYEHSLQTILPFDSVKQKKYGKIAIDFFKKENYEKSNSTRYIRPNYKRTSRHNPACCKAG